MYIDGTKVEANASLDSLKPRFAVEAHLNTLFAPEAEQAAEEAGQATSQEEGSSNEAGAPEVKAPMRLPTSISVQEYEELSQGNAERHDWLEHLGAQKRNITSCGYQRIADLRVSTTDPDATLMETKNGSAMG